MSDRLKESLFRADASRALPTFLICLLGAAIEGYDIQALAISSPVLIPLFGLTKIDLGLLFAITNAGMTAGAAFGGWLGDRFGTKTVFSASVALFGICTCAAAGANGFETLALARFLAGLGFGAAMPITVIMMMSVCTPSRRMFVTTTALCGTPAGGILAIATMTAFSPGLDWRELFLLGGVAALVLAAVAMLLLPAKSQVITEAAQLEAMEKTSWREALFAQGRWPATLLLWILFVCAFLTAWIFITWLPVLVIGKGFPALVGQHALLAYSAGGITGAILIGRSIDSVGFRNILTPAFALMVLCVLGLAAAGSSLQIVIASALIGGCAVGSGLALTSVAAIFYPPQGRGRGVGATIAVGRATSVVAPLAVGGMLAAGASSRLVLIFVALSAFVAAVALVILSGLERRNNAA